MPPRYRIHIGFLIALIGCNKPAASGPQPPLADEPRHGGRGCSEWIKLLQDSDENTRCSAVKALAAIGADAAVMPALVTMTSDASKNVKLCAAIALVSVGDKARTDVIDGLRKSGLFREEHPNAPGPKRAPLAFFTTADVLVFFRPLVCWNPSSGIAGVIDGRGRWVPRRSSPCVGIPGNRQAESPRGRD